MKNVKDFPTIQAALNSFQPGEPVCLYFPAGVYLINQNLTISNSTVSFRGDGQEVTELRFSNGVTCGIQIDNSTPGGNRYPIDIADMSITTENDASGIAIEIKYQGSYDYRWHGRGLLQNLEIRGVTNQNGWRQGVVFHEGVNLSVTHVSFLGKHNQANLTPTANTQSHSAIFWSGAWTPCEFHITDSLFTAWEIGIVLKERTEGVYVQHCVFLLCKSGIVWDIDTVNDRWRPMLVVSDCHFNIYQHGIYLGYVVTSMIHDNLIYLNDQSSDAKGVILNGCGTTTIHHNIFQSFQTQCNGIILTGGSQYCDISSNIFCSERKQTLPDGTVQFPNNFDTGIWLQAGTVFNKVLDNSFYEQCRFCEIYDQGADNAVRTVLPPDRVFK